MCPMQPLLPGTGNVQKHVFTGGALFRKEFPEIWIRGKVYLPYLGERLPTLFGRASQSSGTPVSKLGHTPPSQSIGTGCLNFETGR